MNFKGEREVDRRISIIRAAVTGFFVLLLLILGGSHRREGASFSGGRVPPGEMVFVPAGSFIRGSNKVDTEKKASEFGTMRPWYLDEHPEQRVFVPAFFIDAYEATNAEYKRFIEATNSRPPLLWEGREFPAGREGYPVTMVNWYEADRYCRWAGKRLPTEIEWEKAARGTDGREFPWGDEFDPKKANTGESGIGDLAPVGSFDQGVSPYGVYDMAGNVLEWTSDWYTPYPGATYTSDLFGEKFKVIRGGSWGGPGGHYALPLFFRSAYRSFSPPEERYNDLGLRCARDAQ